MLTFAEFRRIRKTYLQEPRWVCKHIYSIYKRNKKIMDCDACLRPSAYIQLAPLPCAVPGWDLDVPYPVCKQEGKIPMRYNENSACANATVQAQPSDTAVTRDYLLKRLASADYPKDQELRKLYNLYVDNTPKTYKEMIDIIKAGTYTIDPKIAKRIDAVIDGEDDFCEHYGPMYGIVWPGPQADFKGFEAAIKDKTKQYTAAKDVIMTDLANGLKAIQDFEAWLPTPATPVQ